MIIKRMAALLLALLLLTGAALAAPEALRFTLQLEPKQAAGLADTLGVDSEAAEIIAEVLKLCAVDLTADGQDMRLSLIVNGKEVAHIADTAEDGNRRVATGDLIPGIALLAENATVPTDEEIQALYKTVRHLPALAEPWINTLPFTEEHGSFFSTFAEAPIRRTYVLDDRDINVFLQDLIWILELPSLQESLLSLSAWLDGVFAYDNADTYELQLLCAEDGRPLGFTLRCLVLGEEEMVLTAGLDQKTGMRLVLPRAGAVIEGYLTEDEPENTKLALYAFSKATGEFFFISEIGVSSGDGELCIGTSVQLPGILSYTDETVFTQEGFRYALTLEGKDKPLLTAALAQTEPHALAPDPYETVLTPEQLETPDGVKQLNEALEAGLRDLPGRLLKAVPPMLLLKLMKYGIFH